MSFLLMVFLAGVCLFTAYPEPYWGGPPWLAALLTAAAVVVSAGLAAVLARRVGRPLDADPTLLDRQMAEYERGRHWHTVATLVLYATALWFFGWGWAVLSLHGGRAGPGAEILLILPYLLAQTASWVFFYDADRAAHAAAHRLHDLASFAPGGGRPVPPFGGRWAYVAFQLRQRLALAFLPVVLLVLQAELFRLLPESVSRGPLAVWPMLLFAAVVLFLGLPVLVRLVLGLRPLPAGPLRERLQAAARRQGVGLADILVWDTRGGTANAMIIGLVPWVRYVVFTDRLLEDFTAEEIQAVFGHELGHARHQHMLYYLCFLVMSMVAVFLVSENFIVPGLKAVGEMLPKGWGRTHFQADGAAALVVMLGLLLGYILIVFGLVSRGCERQADVFGCRSVSCSDPACQGHHADTPERADGPPCPTGVAVFIAALDKVAAINGIDREKPGYLQSWQHGSIAGRAEFLRGMLTGRPAEPQFQRRLWLFKWGLAASLALALVWLLAAYGVK